jgi:glyoxylase-like metal-dependent hydrolase (beta-lactamase superfamily II)
VKISSLTVGPFEENCYLVVDESAGHAVLIDPGDEGARIVQLVQRSGAALDAIWLTHAHVDHVGGIAAVRRTFDVPIHLHPADEPLYRSAGQQAAMFGLPFDEPPLFDQRLADGDVMRVGDLEFIAMHTPGHAPGHIVFHGNGVALGGDLLFAGSIGRTDLPLSNPAHMSDSLERICTLPDATIVYPGHGARTTIETERRSNPFLTGAARLVRG